jgi:hypothetical protein
MDRKPQATNPRFVAQLCTATLDEKRVVEASKT